MGRSKENSKKKKENKQIVTWTNSIADKTKINGKSAIVRKKNEMWMKRKKEQNGAKYWRDYLDLIAF